MGYGDNAGQPDQRLCSKCNGPLTFVTQYNSWYCYNCKSYESVGDAGSASNGKVAPLKTEFQCPSCGDVLYYIRDYDSHFCYKCNAYQKPVLEPEDTMVRTEPEPVIEPIPEIDPDIGFKSSTGPGPDDMEDDELKCPDCGELVEEGWRKCPNCSAVLDSDMPEKPVTSPDVKAKSFFVEEPTLGEKKIYGKQAPDVGVKEFREAGHPSEYKWARDISEEGYGEWEDSAEKESHDWKASAQEERQEREQTSYEEEDEWNGSAKEETAEWRKEAHEERQSWTESAEEERRSWTESAEDEYQARLARAEATFDKIEVEEAPIKAAERKEAAIPNEHAVRISDEVLLLVEIFEEIFSAFLKTPMEPLSFYKSKLRVLSQRSDFIRKMNVEDSGKVKVFLQVNEFEKVLASLTLMFDTLIETETKIAGKAKAMARAKEALQPVIEDFEEGLEDLGIMSKILKGAFATRLSSGVPGFDEMVHGGIPNGASIIVQGATGGEKEMFANQFIAEGLRSDGSVMISISMISPNEWRNQMKTVKMNPRRYEKDGQVVIVDWYTQKNERVRSVEVKGSVILSSKSITNLEIAIDKAIKVIRDAPTKRAVIAILSPAIKALGFDKVYGFAQSVRGKFKKYGITGLFLLEKKMHDDKVVTSLHSVFDGVFDIERQRKGDEITRKIGIMSLKGSTYDSSYRELDLTRNGLVLKPKEDPSREPYQGRTLFTGY